MGEEIPDGWTINRHAEIDNQVYETLMHTSKDVCLEITPSQEHTSRGPVDIYSVILKRNVGKITESSEILDTEENLFDFDEARELAFSYIEIFNEEYKKHQDPDVAAVEAHRRYKEIETPEF
ncbi:MAG: hypothetical protein SV377_02930 [Halobacteria archaeon]|nr:hypothetical protein [Halobacteria archaeon]